MPEKGIYIIGASGHAKVVISLIRECGYKCLGFYDDNKELLHTTVCGIPVLGAVSELPDVAENSAVIAIGDNKIREQIAGKFKEIRWVTLVHPYSWVDKSVEIGEGSVIFAGAVIQPDVKIGRHSIINTSASIDHDCKIGDFTHIAPGCHICGAAEIGNKILLGVGTSVIPCVKIADDIIIGAGSVVINDLIHKALYVGTPARQTDRQTDL